MICVNEWESPEWVTLEWDAIPPEAGKAPKRPPATPVGRVPNLVDAISGALGAMRPRSPSAVHFYPGEGLFWIRVGFATGPLLRPASVQEIGDAIRACVARQGVLYFHALRPRDALFFLEGGHASKVGMPPSSFGVPFGKLRQAWSPGRLRTVKGIQAKQPRRVAA